MRAHRALILVLVLLAPTADAAARRHKKSATATKQTPAPADASTSVIEPAPSKEEAPAASPAGRRAPAPVDASAEPLPPPSKPKTFLGGLDRINVSFLLGFDSARMNGSQSINQFKNDESFDTGGTYPGVSVSLLFLRAPGLRMGPELRYLGTYGTGQGNNFIFGPLAQAAFNLEYALHVVERFDALFGARAGISVLFPTGNLEDEIQRLQAQGVRTLNIPRFGLVGGLSLGVRRPLIGALAARIQFFGELEHLFLFYDRATVNGLGVQKDWALDARRLGLTLGLEVAF